MTEQEFRAKHPDVTVEAGIGSLFAWIGSERISVRINRLDPQGLTKAWAALDEAVTAAQ